MVKDASKLGLLLVVFTLASGELLKEERPSTDKAKLRDWFFRLSLTSDLLKLKEEGQDYLPVVKLDTDDGEGEDFSILLEEDHPHPKNNCSEESASQEKLMRFVMRGLDQEFMCTEIKKKTVDVPEERSMSLEEDSRRGPGRSFVREKKGEKPGFAKQSREELAKGDIDSVGTDEDIDQIITKLNNIGTVLGSAEANVEVKLVSNVEESEDVKKYSLGSFRNHEARIVTSEDSVKEQSTTEKDCTSSINKNLVEIISDFNKMVESASSDKSLKDAEEFAEVIGDKNETKTANGLDPLIDHLNAVAAHQDFQDPVYAKAIQDLVRDFRAHKLSEATWNGEKLNRVLDKIEELVTGLNPEEDTLTDVSAVEVVEVSTSEESAHDDVNQMKKELEILQQISSSTDRPVEDKQDISTVNQTLGLFISNLHNLVEIVNKTESPEARSGGSSNEERDSISERAKNRELMESLLETNMTEVLEDLYKFVEPIQRSGDKIGEARNDVIAEANTTSGEEVATKESTTDVTSSSVSPGTDSVTVIHEITSFSEGSLATENSLASRNITVDSVSGGSTEESDAEENTLASGNITVDSASGGSTEESDAEALNDNTLDEDYDTEGFMNLLSSWKKKFFIILGCFIVSLVLFLIIIAVLIYKLQQSKPNPDATK